MNKKITFHCTTVTPMFISGADGAKAELRVPSIKGLIRFWWRAMNAHLSLDEMRKKEVDIFGGVTDTPKRSAVTIRLDNCSDNKKTNSLDDIMRKKGINYLFYSVQLNERDFIDENFNFSITFSSKNENVLDEVIKAFGMLVNFGGVGTRSRRGAGSFVVNKTDPESLGENDFLFNLKDITSIDQLTKHYKKISNFLSNLQNEDEINDNNKSNSEVQQRDKLDNEKGKNAQSTLKNSQVYFFDPVSDWKSALNKIGRTFADFRKERNTGKSAFNFGIPITKKNGDEYIAESDTDFPKTYERRSSPLIFKVLKTSQKRFFPIIIWLNGDLIPDNYEMKKINKNKHTPKKVQPSTDIIKKYLDQINKSNNMKI